MKTDKAVRPLNNAQGFTLIELMLAMFLLSVLFLTVWGILGQCFIFWKRVGDKVDQYDSLRISLDRMCREIRYAQSLSDTSDDRICTFVNAEGNNVSYYCKDNQLLRMGKGVATPLASDIASVRFAYVTKEGLVISRSDPAGQKLLPNWSASVSLLTISLTAKKQDSSVDPVVLTQKIQLRALP